MVYIRQKNTGQREVIVASNGEQALSLYPEIFEAVAGDPPPAAEYLHFAIPEGEE
jgi:hypothetical protein